jgi:hypothetical protein
MYVILVDGGHCAILMIGIYTGMMMGGLVSCLNQAAQQPCKFIFNISM